MGSILGYAFLKSSLASPRLMLRDVHVTNYTLGSATFSPLEILRLVP